MKSAEAHISAVQMLPQWLDGPIKHAAAAAADDGGHGAVNEGSGNFK